MSVYLDFAATSALRPPEVVDAVTAFLRDVGATPGRGAYGRAADAGRMALRCRTRLARLFNIPGDPGRIGFMSGATHALNTALWGTLRRGDAVVVTQFDHNAVLRPVRALERERGIEVRIVEGAPDGSLDLDGAARMIAGARVVVVNGVSNVLGTRLPIEALAGLARDAGALVLLDAAQMAGHLPLDVQALNVDLLAITGHKALLAPQGIGALWVREGVDVEPLLRGGTGGDSRLDDMPRALPDRLEAGTLNSAGIAGLDAGVAWLEREGVAALHARLDALRHRLLDGLVALPGTRVLSPGTPGGAPIVTLTAEEVEPSELAARLDRLGVACRAGLHCAPLAHRVLGTEQSGAVRLSLGWASTAADVDAAIDAVERALTGPVTTGDSYP
ncbi:MAG TPA: aminotransferase class V-fold PLP-dependent enzyme [Longimicrobiales bacterium]